MADFVAVLRKAIDGVADPTPEIRQRVYQKARATVASKLAAMNPQPPVAAAERQKQALEDAIEFIEAEFRPAVDDDGFDELEDVFASLNDPAPVEPADDQEDDEREPAKASVAPVVAPSPALTPAPVAATSRSYEPPVRQDDATLDAAERPAFPDLTAQDASMSAPRRRPSGRTSGMVLAIAAFVVVILGGGGYALWLSRSATTAPTPREIAAEPAATPPATQQEPAATPEPQQQAALPEPADGPDAEPEAPISPDDGASDDGSLEKFTQRLNPDGSEIDVGPAGGEPTIGEGTSVSEVTPPDPAATPPSAPADAAPADQAQAAEDGEPDSPPAEQAPAAIAVGQRAIFYEERTSNAQGSAESGSIVWSVVQESPGGDLPPEPAIRAEANIPGKDLQLRMTIRRNGDQTLPASHIVEMIFLTPDTFEGGGIDNVLRMTMKDSEQSTGNPLLGIPAKISDGFFLLALADGAAESEANMTLLRRQSWIDIPIVYRSGRRALITMEKGIPGERVFDEAMRAWAASSG